MEKEIGKVTHYYNHLAVGIIKLTAPVAIGDTIHIKGAHDDLTQAVASMQSGKDKIEKAKAGEEVGVKVIQKVHENDKVYKMTG